MYKHICNTLLLLLQLFWGALFTRVYTELQHICNILLGSPVYYLASH